MLEPLQPSSLEARTKSVSAAAGGRTRGPLPDTERTAALVALLDEAGFFGGLSGALDQVEDFHPPAVIDALFRGLLQRDGITAVHFAAMLLFLHGEANSAFDLDQRPFLFRFLTEDPKPREAAARALCLRIQVDPGEHLRALRA